jgi:hypothetical protein
MGDVADELPDFVGWCVHVNRWRRARLRHCSIALADARIAYAVVHCRFEGQAALRAPAAIFASTKSRRTAIWWRLIANRGIDHGSAPLCRKSLRVSTRDRPYEFGVSPILGRATSPDHERSVG